MNMIATDSSILVIENILIGQAALVYRAINNKTRQAILRKMHAKKQITVTELYTDLELEQPVVSNHLAALRRTGFVITQRIGRQILYSINYSRLEHLHLASAKILSHSLYRELAEVS
jgi:DNA-binding transcriptional ArsR family regulator